VAVVPGTDGRKMSKSYDNAIELFLPEKQVRKKIMSIVTDSTPVEDPKDPANCNVMALLCLIADENERAEWEERYRKGGTGYGETKKRVFELFVEALGPARAKYDELNRNRGHVEEVLRKGGQRARAVAGEVMADVRKATGIMVSRER
jgi:tryptophanyl-tRNA synthetase